MSSSALNLTPFSRKWREGHWQSSDYVSKPQIQRLASLNDMLDKAHTWHMAEQEGNDERLLELRLTLNQPPYLSTAWIESNQPFAAHPVAPEPEKEKEKEKEKQEHDQEQEQKQQKEQEGESLRVDEIALEGDLAAEAFPAPAPKNPPESVEDAPEKKQKKKKNKKNKKKKKKQGGRQIREHEAAKKITVVGIGQTVSWFAPDAAREAR